MRTAYTMILEPGDRVRFKDETCPPFVFVGRYFAGPDAGGYVHLFRREGARIEDDLYAYDEAVKVFHVDEGT